MLIPACPVQETAASPPHVIEAVIARVLQVYRSWRRDTSIATMRQDWDHLFCASPLDAPLEAVSAGGVDAAWVRAPGCRSDQIVVYLHGGGFTMGSLVSHHELMAAIGMRSGCSILGLAYRLAPEHRFPDSLTDVCTAYRWLLDQGHAPSKIAFAGDSAGGGLVLSGLVALKNLAAPLPAAAVLMSPLVDLTASGESYGDPAIDDPVHRREQVLVMARGYAGGTATDDPRLSPLFADLAGLPPLLVQVGAREVLLSEAISLVDRALAQGVEARGQVWPGMIHVFQQFPDLVEAVAALDSVGAFIRSHMNQTTGALPSWSV